MIQDIQSGGDTRATNINDVGIRALKLPIRYNEQSITHATVGEWSVSTNLSANKRGTHMSRLVRILHDIEELSYPRFCDLPDMLCSQLDATCCFISVDFTYFVEKTAPISGEKSLLDIAVQLIARRDTHGERFLMQVVVPVTSLCPCSKAISKYGAHNQRSHVTLTVEPQGGGLLVRDLVAITEMGGSSELFSVLKRVDERHVTEQAYNNPKFVEDIVRDLAVSMQRAEEVKNYRIEAENFESIHNHSAYAVITSDGFPYLLK